MNEFSEPLVLEDMELASKDLLASLSEAGTADEEQMKSMVAEASTCAEELRVAGEELRSSRLRVAEDETRWAKLFDAAPDGFVVSDEHGKVSEANMRMAEMLSIDSRNLIGKPLPVFVAHDDLRRFRAAMAAVVSGEPLNDMQLHLTTRSGAVIAATVRATLLESTQQEILWSIRDVSAEQLRSQRLELLEHELRVLGEVSQLHAGVQTTQPLDSIARNIVDLASRSLPAYGVALTLRDPAAPDERVELQAWSDEHTRATAAAVLAAGHGHIYDVISKNENIFSEDIADDERWIGLLVPHVAVASFPVGLDDQLFGTICFYDPNFVATYADYETAQFVASHAGSLLHNAKVFGDSATLNDNLLLAMNSRGVIEQAKGMIMMMHKCSEEKAFDVLKTASQRDNIRLREIAVSVIEKATKQGDSTGNTISPTE